MGISRWKIVNDMEHIQSTQVFSGGACNVLDAQGQLLRNAERDRINDWLTEYNITFFDPQIHPDTHGEEYNFEKHHPLEMEARSVAKINLYEVSPRTFSGITSFEIAADHFRWNEPMVLYFSDGSHESDHIPAHSQLGHPLFVPEGIHTNERAMRAHYAEFVKNGNNMRKYLVRMARETHSLTVTFEERVHTGDIMVSPERMHAAEMFRAMVMASSGQRVIVNFSGGPKARDAAGNPLFILPIFPPQVEMRALLDQYVDEGNALRRAIAELIKISVFTRVVYTQRAAILAMEELLRVKRILQ
ncbi:MAG: hypothetical protein HC915_13125 [Anaerolineae bacterium]|nr:hypothetical protein [Anaerolineae bacterium]